jgi:hypothetical protein
MVARRLYGPLILLVAAVGLAGCVTTERRTIRIVETQRVEIPVPTKRQPPAELLEPMVTTELPVFVAPSDPAASSALTHEGERRLRSVLLDLLSRETAWREWANSP